MAKLAQLESVGSNLQPTLVIMETFVEIEVEDHPKPGTLASAFPVHGLPSADHELASTVPNPKEPYGLSLLQHISSEISNSRVSQLVVPIAMIHNWELNATFGSRSPIIRPSRPDSDGLDISSESPSFNHRERTPTAPTVDPRRLQKCLDAGAIDVLVSPLQPDRVYGLTAHAYRARNQASKERTESVTANRSWKRSWVGFESYAWLLENMYVASFYDICHDWEVNQGPLMEKNPGSPGL